MATLKTPRQVPPPERREGERRTPYQRFIPKEELRGFSAWNPDALAGAPATRPPISAPAPPPAPEAPPPPEPNIEELQTTARHAGYQDGYRDGLAALEAFKQSYAKQISTQIATLVGNFDTELRALEDQMAETLARCAVELARQVVRSEISQRPEFIAHVAHDAVAALQLSARHVRVRVNPADLALVQAGAGEEMRAREAQIIPDEDVPRGGCRVDADIGSVDATLAARWQQAMAAFGQSSLWQDRRSGSGDEETAP